MIIHEGVHDFSGGGKWDMHTTRYVPVQGGSRSRLPIADDPHYHRYPAYVGIDEHLTPDIFHIAQLYHYIGGAPILHAGTEGKLTEMFMELTMGRLEATEEEAAGSVGVG